MSLRAFVVFVVGVAIVRLGSRRFLGQSTAFDLLLAVVLGSVLSRTINGGAEFGPTLVACATLVGIHWLFAALAFRSHRVGLFVKGRERFLVRDGVVDWPEMERCKISKRDLLAAMRLRAGTEEISRVRIACLERNGEISVVVGHEGGGCDRPAGRDSPAPP
jgi:uncharacterized membrane protein YcaP (DUF421 family)